MVIFSRHDVLVAFVKQLCAFELDDDVVRHSGRDDLLAFAHDLLLVFCEFSVNIENVLFITSLLMSFNTLNCRM